MSVARTLPVALLLSAAACDARAPASKHTVRDSAGVRIVESHAPAWAPEDAWRVDAEPILSLGAVDGPPELSFARVLGAYRLAAGDLAVFDGTANELRLFDAGGRHVRSVGRAGDGPGEFQRVIAAGILGDTVWLYDRAAGRLTFVHGRSGSFRVASVEARNLGLGSAGSLEDGSLVLVADVALTDAVEERPPAGFHRWGAAYLRIGPQGRTLDTILQVPGTERLLRYGNGTIELLRPLFARTVSHATRGNEIVYGDQERYELRMYGAGGTLQRVTRRTDVGLSLMDEAYRAAVEERVRAAPEPARPGLRRLYESVPPPATRPAYARLLVDPHDALWVQDWSVDGEATGWSVFDSTGAWQGVVTFPPRFRPTHIRSAEVVGVWQDELDVEHVRVHGLDRGKTSTTDEER